MTSIFDRLRVFEKKMVVLFTWCPLEGCNTQFFAWLSPAILMDLLNLLLRYFGFSENGSTDFFPWRPLINYPLVI